MTAAPHPDINSQNSPPRAKLPQRKKCCRLEIHGRFYNSGHCCDDDSLSKGFKVWVAGHKTRLLGEPNGGHQHSPLGRLDGPQKPFGLSNFPSYPPPTLNANALVLEASG